MDNTHHALLDGTPAELEEPTHIQEVVASRQPEVVEHIATELPSAEGIVAVVAFVDNTAEAAIVVACSVEDQMCFVGVAAAIAGTIVVDIDYSTFIL